VTVAHAAADSVATGDFSRAAALYRELARREPKNQAYSQAARILTERTQPRAP
jgi:RNA polymerase-interacting CarD/CdnL/TRCF family regulator